jgi:O-antigen ligase
MPSFKSYFTHKNAFLFGLFLVIVGMPLSKFLMSVGQFVLLANWILESDFKRKWQVMKTSKVLWVISSFYLLHLIGLLWTSDFAYATNDLKIKLPLLWFPLLFITSKQTATRNEIQGLLWFFTASVFIASIVCTMVWLGYTKHKVIDIRDISIFNSHIRFALMIDLVICFLLYDFFKTGKLLLYLIKIGLITWLVVFLGIMQSFTGIVVLFIVLGYYSILFLKKIHKPILKISAFAIIGFIASFIIYLVIKRNKGTANAYKTFIATIPNQARQLLLQ